MNQKYNSKRVVSLGKINISFFTHYFGEEQAKAAGLQIERGNYRKVIYTLGIVYTIRNKVRKLSFLRRKQVLIKCN